MFSYDAILAAALLTSPPVSLPVSETAPWSGRLQSYLIIIAVEMEVLDAREGERVFQSPVDFSGDLAMLQSRSEDLLNAPMTEEAGRFPCSSVVKSFLSLNRAMRRESQERMAFDVAHGEELGHALAEIDYLYRVWDAVREAGSPCFYITVRRQALRRTRDLVGMEAFYRGQLPPHVPLWMIPTSR